MVSHVLVGRLISGFALVSLRVVCVGPGLIGGSLPLIGGLLFEPHPIISVFLVVVAQYVVSL